MDIILILLIIIILLYSFFNSTYFTALVKACSADTNCESYRVSQLFSNQTEAASLMDSINMRVIRLMKYMKSKYSSIPDNTITYRNMTININKGIDNILTRYSKDRLTEISPFNSMGYTSYTEDKSNLVLCLRDKTGKLYDINTMMFVTLHELAHMMNDEWGHTPEFWIMFEFLLENAADFKLYVPVNYREQPINYCGLNLTHNPLFR